MQSINSKRFAITLVAVSVGSFLVLGVLSGSLRLPLLSDDSLPSEFERLEQVYHILDQQYVESERIADTESLVEGAIRGLIDAVDDPYTHYLDAELYDIQTERLDGSFAGIGVRLRIEDDALVMSPIEDTPAMRAGLQDGDLLLAVDGVSTVGITESETVLRVRGESGTPVVLTVSRIGTATPFDVEIIRDTITVNSVEVETLRGGIPLFRVSGFSRTTGEEIATAIDAIDLNTIPGIVIDLRGNPGGLVDAVIEAVGLFLKEGVILHQRDRDGNLTERKNATDGVASDVRVAILVDRHSASASEIFAGAIQDYERGPLIGESTFGKGSVGLLFELSGNTGFSVTSARWLTPLERLIEGEGLNPDIAVMDDPDTEPDEAMERAIAYLLNAS